MTVSPTLLLLKTLPRHPFIYNLCSRYVDRYRGNNDDNPQTNGENRVARQYLPRASVAFDIGANVGDWSTFALLVNPGLTLHCFEPTPSTFAKLSAHVKGANVHLNPVALSDAPSRVKLFTHESSHGTNSLYARAGLETYGVLGQAQTIEVPTETFDHYCEVHGVEAIDFVKLDVEGHELAVLRGMAQSLKSHRVKMLQFEYGGTFLDARTRLLDVFDIMGPQGYSLFKIFPHELKEYANYDPRLEDYQYQNWVAISKTCPL